MLSNIMPDMLPPRLRNSKSLNFHSNSVTSQMWVEIDLHSFMCIICLEGGAQVAGKVRGSPTTTDLAVIRASTTPSLLPQL
jgi:hypothetical protein